MPVFLTLAHVGHWLAELMYVMPVLAIVVWISVKAIIDRRSERHDHRIDAG